ncbi:hypothetical protein [Aquicoccus sp. SU-CL01552]
MPRQSQMHRDIRDEVRRVAELVEIDARLDRKPAPPTWSIPGPMTGCGAR